MLFRFPVNRVGDYAKMGVAKRGEGEASNTEGAHAFSTEADF